MRIVQYAKQQEVSCPENDPDAWEGKPTYSSRVWIPVDTPINIDDLHERAHVVSTKSNRNQPPEEHLLINEDRLHIDMPRHLYPRRMWDEVHTPLQRIPYDQCWDEIDFESKIQIRAEQGEAWEALHAADHGTMHLACGKGKTVLGLAKIAQNRRPAVVLVHNGGLLEQWRSRALEFLGLRPQDIGVVQGNSGGLDFWTCPSDPDEIIDLLHETEHDITRLYRELPDPYVNLNSARELEHLLIERGGLVPDGETPKGRPKLDTAQLTRWALDDGFELPRLILDIRKEELQLQRLTDALAGELPTWSRPLVLAMIPTLVAQFGESAAGKLTSPMPLHIRQRFGTILFDEAHHLPAPTFKRTCDLFFGDRFSLTATANREDGLEDILYAHTGGVIYEDLEPENPASVEIIQLPTELDDEQWDDCHYFPNSYAKKRRLPEWHFGKMYGVLAHHKKRNAKITFLARNLLREGRKVLVVCHARAHPRELHASWLKWNEEFSSDIVVQETSTADRTRIIRENDLTFASIEIVAEGLDSPDLDTIIFATPFQVWRLLQQGKGRVERVFEDKHEPLAIILQDTEIKAARALVYSLMKKMRQRNVSYSISRG